MMNAQITNPVLAGFYPDPSICKAGSDYYLVNSTFSYFPGIPVFHSRDLVNWEQIGNVMDRTEQMNLDSLGVSRGIFAPAIRYNNGIFYVTCTLVDAGGNFVVTAKDPAGPWSNPVFLPEVNGIDPSLFFDDDKAYIIYNSGAPDNNPLYDGHRTIRMYEFDVPSLKVTGTQEILVNGGSDISKKPIWIEGPHIFKKDGYYFLIAAEGGTGYDHSEVVFRSKNVRGPYMPYEGNPILTQRHLDINRDNPVTSTGHADFVEDENGQWWSVFLGCRPYPPANEGYYNTGRETFMAPVKWENGWPVILKGDEVVKYFYPAPADVKKMPLSYSGNFSFKDDFNKKSLALNYLFLRNVRENWYNINREKGVLEINLRPEEASGNMNPSFIGHRQQHLKGYAAASMDFTPASENEKAGLMIFQNEDHYYFLCKSVENNKPVVQLFKSAHGGKNELLASAGVPDGNIKLKINADNNIYRFYYSTGDAEWKILKDNIDASYLSTRTAGGFVGCLYAMYATSSGKQSGNKAAFDWFEYTGNDDVYVK